MNPGEYRIMSEVEERHWWYAGLRDTVSRTLLSGPVEVPEAPVVLDAGCGTGENLRLLRKLFNPSYLGGFDLSEEALDLAREKADDADLYRSDICDPEIRTEGIDLILSLDVIYIPGVERAFEGLKDLVASMKKGGLFVVNLPAYNWLYSEHDAAVHTHQRFTTREVGTLFSRLGLEVVLLTYRMFFLFPAVVLARVPSIIRARTADLGERARSDLHREPGATTNHLLLGTLRMENMMIAGGARLPWGSSVFAIGRKS